MALIHDGETGTGRGTAQQLDELYYDFDIRENPDSGAVTVETIDGANTSLIEITMPPNGTAVGVLVAHSDNTAPDAEWSQEGTFRQSAKVEVPN
ncbi:MAG: hypothetical protein GVY12_04020 [Bacteroidetes bacterium]|jgi:hypothetical protein|nr:hypothetical protein [Bacteroidota bacterium]